MTREEDNSDDRPNWLQRFWYFFPIQLLMLHIKRNHFLLVFWVLLFGFTTGMIAQKYGVSYLFLYPEYFGKNDFLAFSILGFSFGGFLVAFNLYTYILHGFRFYFIATVNRPFLKFSYNNLILPVSFLVVYIWYSVEFQIDAQLISPTDALINIIGLLSGIFLFLLISYLYFMLTNRTVRDLPAKEEVDLSKGPMVQSQIHRQKDWTSRFLRKQWRVDSYMYNLSSVRLARDGAHYDRETMQQILIQNHINASIFQILLVASFLLFVSLGDTDIFGIPAASSIILFFTISLMIVSAIFSWIKGWTMTLFIAALVAVNYYFESIPVVNIPNHAYGLDYDAKAADYSPEYISSLNFDNDTYDADVEHGIIMLEKWKKKCQKFTGKKKPKLLIVNCSGGGMRSVLWTMTAMADIDEQLDGHLMPHTRLITGSSGGMIGAAYMRELYRRQARGELNDFRAQEYRDRISSDLLNPVMFTMATNDFFIRLKKTEYKGRQYTFDRATAFENELNKTTGGLLDIPLSDYQKDEMDANVPMMVLSPTIVNDGRRLLISSQPISYLSRNIPLGKTATTATPEDIEFSRLFAGNDASNLRFLSALRMNATFPYILPIVELPSEPEIEVMDAGLRDNFGTKTTLQFLYTFREWIDKNTSGVVILQMRDLPRRLAPEQGKDNLVNKFTTPLGSLYGNVFMTQDFNNDQMVTYLATLFEKPVDILAFTLRPHDGSYVSLSWHLTQSEKAQIEKAVESDAYLFEIERLKLLLQ